MSNKIRVAVAEDEDYLRNYMCRAIRENEVMELIGDASTGKCIVELVAEKPVDIVLMDVEMERYDSGIQAAAKIAEINPNIIIVFLTVHEEDEVIYQAFSVAPKVDYIVKSATRESILKKIEDVYYSRNSIDPKIMRTLTREFYRMSHSKKNLMGFYNVIFTITPSEKELIKMLLEGKSISQIAKMRFVQDTTVKTQINILHKKFHVKKTKEILAQIRDLGVSDIFN